MRRHLLTLLVCVLLCLVVLPGTASVDSRSEPVITIMVVDAPMGEYHLDLLVTGSGGHTNIDPADYDSNLLQELRDWEVDGQCSALARGTSVPLLGDLWPGEGGIHRFTYHGLPHAFHVVVSGPDGAQATDEPPTRAMFYTHLTYDWRTNFTTRAVSPAGFHGVQFLSTLVSTPLVEGRLLWLSGFRARRDWLVLPVANLVTQAGFHLWIAADLVSIGDSALQYLMLLAARVPILLVELITYVFLLKEYSGLRRATYAACANTANHAVGYLPLRWAVESPARQEDLFYMNGKI